MGVMTDVAAAFSRALSPYGATTIGPIYELASGRLNSVFAANTSIGPMVLRRRDLVNPEYHQSPIGEKDAYQLVHEPLVRKPDLLWYDTTCTQEPFAWGLFRHIDGPTLDRITEPYAFRLLGAAVARVHTPAPGFGKIDGSPMAFGPNCGSLWLEAMYWHEYPMLRGKQPRLADRVMSFAQHWCRQLYGDAALSPVLIHGDAHGKNVIYNRGEVWLIDWEACRFRCILSELAKMRVFNIGSGDPNLWSEIISGYEEIRRLPDDWQVKLRPFETYAAVRQLMFEEKYPTTDQYYPNKYELARLIDDNLRTDGF